jgi:hypothetical protein
MTIDRRTYNKEYPMGSKSPQAERFASSTNHEDQRMLRLRFDVDHAPAKYQPVVVFPDGSRVPFGTSCTDRVEASVVCSWLNVRGAGDELAAAVIAYVDAMAKVTSEAT